MSGRGQAGNGDRDRAIDLAVNAIEKQFGKGAIMRLGEEETLFGDVPVVPSGSTSLDIALGIGGYARGRIVEVYGPEGWRRPHPSRHRQAQRMGGVAAPSMRSTHST